ncbi:MAG TPA: enoyl-CoA hydratase-related protein [Solirubrobacteraceae bacterium]|nr:enoyl-CoA hydratase-related protein [Solirubrobacteraceae bacterium]
MSVVDPRELPRLFAECVNAGDLEGLIALYEDGATLVGPDGVPVAGNRAIRECLEQLLAMTPHIVPVGGRAMVVGDIALISGDWQMRFGGQRGGGTSFESSSTEVARRQHDGSWLYVIDDPTSTVGARDAASRAVEGPAEFEQLLYEQDDQVARITLNRPERHNALSMRLSEELAAALELVRDSTTVKVLVVQGAGGTFCAGDDITEMNQWGDANEIVRRVRGYQRMADTLADLDKVTVAVVDGFAVGGGLEITMACDFVVAAARARWGMPEVDVGITPGWGGTTRMTRLIGRRMTKEVNLLGALYPAARAVELGLWNRVVDDERLGAEVDALIRVLLSKNQQAVRQLKLIIDKGAEADLHTAQGFEALSVGLTGALNGAWAVPDADQSAGIVSFVTGGERWQKRRSLARDFWTEAASER